jgi:hypothetical protein
MMMRPAQPGIALVVLPRVVAAAPDVCGGRRVGDRIQAGAEDCLLQILNRYPVSKCYFLLGKSSTYRSACLRR